ncbi:MAG: ABC transporter substrate-binding protein [Armatimonadota bacterium]|nr:ABC transporter substrate-binding protein [Armatimonadota bacterium]MDR7449599.1 ABC transporter substrate-binding protein [Armatimonadota bacterium]MDR7460362.1 ABC transporter substrate-binding protein [Armatimonadota bacterium]MDR7488095.1 ABC transporter substrate-binding protein [Armatimonadota bacterium]MDR7492130.1 ABC transporter substrate-binding protein [Armatimonadota bacterium]
MRVGLLLPLRSGVAASARVAAEGAQLAVDEVNREGGVRGRRVRLAVEDDQRVPEEAVRLVAALVGQEAVGIVGPLTDPTTIAAAGAATRFRIVLISPGAIEVLPYGGHYVFRTAISARAQGAAVAAFVADRLRVPRVAVVHDSSEYGTAVAMAFEED